MTSPLPAEGQYGGKALWVNMGKTKVLYLGQGSVCFRSLAKTPAACVSRAWALTPFSVVVVPVGSTRNVVASLALWTHLWSLIPASGVNGVLDRPDQWQRSQWVGRRWRWCHPSVTLGTAYPGSGGGCELAIITRSVVAGQVNFSNWLQGTAVLNCHQVMRKFESFTMMTNDFRLTNARQI